MKWVVEPLLIDGRLRYNVGAVSEPGDERPPDSGQPESFPSSSRRRAQRYCDKKNARIIR